jgi:hypothetical protein
VRLKVEIVIEKSREAFVERIEKVSRKRPNIRKNPIRAR